MYPMGVADTGIPSPSRQLTCGTVHICELEWVLSSVYEVPKDAIVETLRRLLNASEFEFIDRTAVTGALNGYESGRADFSDYLIGASAARAGAATTRTFDRALRRADGFSLVR